LNFEKNVSLVELAKALNPDMYAGDVTPDLDLNNLVYDEKKLKIDDILN